MNGRIGIFAVIGLVLAVLASCSGGNNDTDCRCPANQFRISVPANRASDVQSVTATGACSIEPPGQVEVDLTATGAGTCHIAVTFKSGAPEYDTDVALVQGTAGCEAACAPVPTSSVAVPELDGGAGALSGCCPKSP
jgi:hypothetical protein